MPRATLKTIGPAAIAAGAALAASAAGMDIASQAAAAIAGLGAGLVIALALHGGGAAPAPDPARDPALRAALARAGAAERAAGIARRALAQLPRPLLLVDDTGRIIFANPAARATFARLRVGEHHSMTFRNPDFLEALGATLAGGAARSFDFTLHGDRGRVFHAHLDGATETEAETGAEAGAETGAETGAEAGGRTVLCLFEDRTQQMRSARLRTDFIANASHELRTPLTSIRGFIETIQGPARDDPEARDRFLGIMQAQAQRMQRLVDGLLSLSRIELNQHIRPDGREDLGLLAREAVAALEPVARARGVRIETDGLPGDAAGDKAGDAVGAGISDGASDGAGDGAGDGVNARAIGPIVRGDRDQLTQALGNLIENALKYGAGQPVRVFLAAPSHDRPGMVGLTVADCGEGIARDHLPRLTERFYRVSVKRSRDQGGTGLGLAIVKHIMARHHGALSIDSAPGLGSAFTLWLPTAPSDGDSAAAGDGASAAPGVEAPAQVAGAPRASGGAAP